MWTTSSASTPEGDEGHADGLIAVGGPHTLALIAEDDVGSTCAVERSVIITTRPEVETTKPGEVLYYVDHPVGLRRRHHRR